MLEVHHFYKRFLDTQIKGNKKAKNIPFRFSAILMMVGVRATYE